MKKSKLFLIALISTIGLSACSKDDDKKDTNTGEGTTISFVNATSYTDWVYFSFEKGKIVEVSDFKNDLTWDIAFHRGDVRLNGGASGKGAGAAVNTDKKNWKEVTAAPTSGYVADAVGEIVTSFTGTGVTTDEQPFSQTLAGWITIDTSSPPPVYTYHNWVYVVKAANGNYVKLQIYDYKNEKNAGAYISFKYQSAATGSSKF